MAWARQRWRPLALSALVLPLALAAAVGTLSWPGRTFPGFFVMGNRLVPTIGLPHWTGIEAQVPFHAVIAAVDGTRVATSAEIYDRVAALTTGTMVTYEFEKAGDRTTRTVATMRFGFEDYWLTMGLFLAFATVSVVAGVGVALLQPRTASANAFLVQGVCTGLFAFTGAGLYEPSLWWLSPLHLVMQTFFPAAFVHLGLVFPVARRFVERRPVWLLAPYAVATALAGFVLTGFYADPPDLRALYLAYYFTSACIAVLIALVAYAYVENRTPHVRPTLHAVLPGLVVGTIVALVGFIDIADDGGDFLMNLIAVGPAVFYVSIAYAILRHGLFDIDRLLRLAVVYVVLTAAITACYAASLAVFGALMPATAVRGSPVFVVAFVVLMALVFQPLRSRVQSFVDRAFFRGRPDYRRTVSEVSSALTSVLDRDEIIGRVGRGVVGGLQVRGLRIALWFDGVERVWSWDAPKGAMVESGIQGDLELRQTLGGTPPKVWQLPAPLEVANGVTGHDLDPAIVRVAAALDARLLVPLVVGERTFGLLGVGAKASGRRFDDEDLALLETLAAQSAIALENAHSYRALAALNVELEAKVTARTAELATSNAGLARSNAELASAYRELQSTQAQLVQSEKLASLGHLVAGVAHELNNPASFVHGGLANLVEYLEVLVTAITRYEALAGADPAARAEAERVRRELRLDYVLKETPELLRICSEGSERIKTIVEDLRVFVRTEQGERVPVDLRESIDGSLRLLGDRVARAGVSIVKHYDAVPAVEAHRGQLDQVWTNLLVNALDAVEGQPSPEIHISVRDAQATPEGNAGSRWIEVVVGDNGTGMSRETLGKVFDPFFTTKAVGQGTGLGLSIAYGAVRSHGGTITATSEVRKGTTLTVRLPVARGAVQAA